MLGARKVLVVGGGIAGLALANSLKRVGVDYQVLEQAPSFGDVGFGITLGFNAMETLKLISPELAQRVKGRGVPGTTFAILDKQGKVLFEPRPSNRPERNEYGSGQFLPIKRTYLQQELLRDIPDEKIATSVVAKDFHQDESGVTLVAEDGREFTGDLLVGADGIHSSIREGLHSKYGAELGPAPALRYSNYSLWGGQVRGVEVPKQDGQETFFWSLLDDKKLFITLPMPGDVQYWSYGEVREHPISDSSDDVRSHEDCKEMLLAEARPLPSWHAELVDATDLFVKWDLYDIPRPSGIKRWGHGRVTVMGDAAHAVTPWVGQGGSISIEDAADLAYRLAHTEDWPEAVAKFEAARIPRAHQVRTAADMNFDAFTQHTSSAVRRLINSVLWRAMRVPSIYDMLTMQLTKVTFPPEPLRPVAAKERQ